MVDFTFAHRQEGFDEHIDWSIRGYSDMLKDVVAFSRYFVEDETNVVDIGCSTGKVTEQMISFNSEYKPYVKWVGVEVAEGFFGNLDQREKNIMKKYDVNVEFIKDDVRSYDFVNCSLVTSIFTLQFMPKKDRSLIISDIYNGLNTGGAFIFAEKIDCTNSRIQDMMTFNYYDFKRQKFETEDIMDKEKTLRHMLKPNTLEELEDMIYEAGFKNIQPFWQNHLFMGAIAIK